jgi:nucleoside-diphosphate-sugar epimerase
MSKTILVTGASGFIGKFVVPALAKQGWQVRAAARDPNSILAKPGVEIVAMPDLKDAVDWAPLLDGVSHVVHLAGIAHSPGMLPDDVYARINALSVGALAKAAKGRIERLVLMSSVRAQAGLASDHVITEADTPRPTDAYGRSKLEAERLIGDSGVAFTVLRPAVVYGPGVKGNISSLATLAKTPMPLPFGALNNRRSLLAIENLASAISLALTSERALGETYLVADREPISVGDMVAAMREGLGRSPHLVRVPERAVRRLMASFGKEAEWERLSGNFVIDSAKLQGLGWDPRVTSREGLARMMRGPANGASAA